MQNLRLASTTTIPSSLALRLASYARLDADDLRKVDEALGPPRAEKAHRELDAEKVLSPRITVLSHGWVGAVALMPDGRRQIVELLMPGDHWMTHENAVLRVGSHALTSVRLRDGGALLPLVMSGESESRIAKAWRASADAARARLVRHLVRLGRMPAYERMSDLLLELHDRQSRAGLVSGPQVLMPLTQEVLADYLGLSVVHVNRVMQQLRRDRLIDYGGGRITLCDIEQLRATAPFSVG